VAKIGINIEELNSLLSKAVESGRMDLALDLLTEWNNGVLAELQKLKISSKEDLVSTMALACKIMNLVDWSTASEEFQRLATAFQKSYLELTNESGTGTGTGN
jgi:hypothetical protein